MEANTSDVMTSLSWGNRIKKPPQANRREKDRKSTRLNSSHGYISYAVFCLKKKKNTTRRRLGAVYVLPKAQWLLRLLIYSPPYLSTSQPYLLAMHTASADVCSAVTACGVI